MGGRACSLRYFHLSDRRKMKACEKLVPGADIELTETSPRVESPNLTHYSLLDILS